MALKKKRIGVFGGTFNPIHYGHLIIAENACEQYRLEKVFFLPTGHTPHKIFMGEDMNRHRCRMTELAIGDNPRFSVSYREIESAAVNYTYRTLEQMKREEPESELFFILGADSLFDFDEWKHPERICGCAAVLAAVRDSLTEKKVDSQIRYLTEKYDCVIRRLDTPNFNVSSKALRERVRNGQSIRYMVPPSVENYIRENHLYLRLAGGRNEI